MTLFTDTALMVHQRNCCREPACHRSNVGALLVPWHFWGLGLCRTSVEYNLVCEALPSSCCCLWNRLTLMLKRFYALAWRLQDHGTLTSCAFSICRDQLSFCDQKTFDLMNSKPNAAPVLRFDFFRFFITRERLVFLPSTASSCVSPSTLGKRDAKVMAKWYGTQC